MEDALISPESFSILSGAGLIAVSDDAPTYVHTTSQIEVKTDNTIILPEEACWNKYTPDDEFYHQSADIFIMAMIDGEIAPVEPCIPAKVADDHKTITCYSHAGKIEAGDIVLVDYYVKRTGNTQMIEITADKFGGNYYIEASTLFRRESDGVDMPAEFIIPNGKVQSNFTFSMAASGDPSTFSFVIDAFPDYTKFDRTHKVLAALQVITDKSNTSEGTRQPCVSNEDAKTVQITGENTGAVFSFDNDSTPEAVKITVGGINVDGTKYNTTAGWPSMEAKGGLGVCVDVKCANIDPINKDYYVIMQNPVYGKYIDKVSGDGHDQQFIGDGIRKATYKANQVDGWKEDHAFSVMVSDLPGDISYKVYEVAESGALTLVQTIDVKNEVSFAPKAKD